MRNGRYTAPGPAYSLAQAAGGEVPDLQVGNKKNNAGLSAECMSAEQVVARFRQRIVIFGVQRLRNRDDAEDLAQETLSRVVAALEKGGLKDPESLPAFVYQTARNVLKERFRKAGRETRALQRYQHEPGEGPVPDAFATLVSAERCREVRSAMQKLSADDRNLLQWLYGQGLDAAEVAARLGMAAGAIRVRKHRALDRLSAALGQHLKLVPTTSDKNETNVSNRQPDVDKLAEPD